MLKSRPYKDLHKMPTRFDTCIENKAQEKEIDIAHYADCFEYHLRCYLIGIRKTLHRVSYENKEFRKLDAVQSVLEINHIFEILRNEIIKKEYYELMKKLKHAEGFVLRNR